MSRHRLLPVAAAALSVALAACNDTSTAPDELAELSFKKSGPAGGRAAVASLGDAVNAALEAQDADYRLGMAEWYGADSEGQTIVFFNNRGNKQLGSHFVPGDPRRGGGTAISWLNELFDGATASGLSPAATAGAIRNAMGTWDAQTCSTIPLNDLGDTNNDLGVVQALFGFGGEPNLNWFADITHAGFLPGPFFDILAPGGGNFILGVTFTFWWVDANGATDIDNNGMTDTAFRDIYYNDNFPWAINGDIDVETVALHEAGHGLSQGHFGKAFLDNGSGQLHFAPLAVMNAAYSGVQQSPAGTDNGGHCSIWGSWPNN